MNQKGPSQRQPAYPGPPRTTPPPRDWRPSVVIEPPPPRALPPQDTVALDTAERAARRLTYAVGAGAGVIALAIACVLSGRVLLSLLS